MKRILFNLIAVAPIFAQQPPIASDPVPQPPLPPGIQLQLPQANPAPRNEIIRPPAPVMPRVQIQRDDPTFPVPANGGASASFEGVARVGRPIQFRVTVIGVTRFLDTPQIPEVEGMTFQAAGRTMTGGGAMVFNFIAIPSRAGTFVVPGFDYASGGRVFPIPQTRLEVAEAQPGEARYQPVISSIEMPKRDFFVGETIPARILFIETPDESPTYVQHVAKTSGTVVFRVENMHRTVEVEVNGAKRRAIAKPVQITPLKEGATEVNCQVIVHVQKRDVSGMGNPGFAMQVQSTIDVPSTLIKVLPLPTVGRLPGFTGAIGQFALSAPKVSANEVEMGEPIILTIALTGEGNLSGVYAPELPADNADWQTFKPTTDLTAANDESAPLLATKTFTYTLIPKRVTARGTPVIPFSYFDPVKGKYVDITVPPQPVKVNAPAVAEPAAVAEEKPKEEEELKGPKPIEPALTGLAETSGMWTHSLRPALWSRWFLAAQLFPIAFITVLWLWRRRCEHLAANPQIMRRRKARVAARAALGEARTAARRGDSGAFLAASTRAIREAAAPLDTAQADSLTQEEVLNILRNDERASKTAKAIFEHGEAHRYGANGTLKPDALMSDLEHTLARLSAKA